MTTVQFIKYAAKFLVALATAAGVAVIALSDNAVSTSEWLQIGIAFLGALGVYAVPNKEQ